MMLGLSLSTFTTLHVVISLIGIAAGVPVMRDMLRGIPAGQGTTIFLVATILTSVTGFLFPFGALLPSHIFGVLSLIALAAALLALYGRALAGPWRGVYLVTALFALYLNSFVAVVQGFQKLPVLNPLAPTGSEPPFLVAQLLLLVAFVWLGWRALKAR